MTKRDELGHAFRCEHACDFGGTDGVAFGDLAGEQAVARRRVADQPAGCSRLTLRFLLVADVDHAEVLASRDRWENGDLVRLLDGVAPPVFGLHLLVMM